MRKHHIAGLLEVDVTTALARLEKQSSAQSEMSFFAWFVKTIAAAIAENRYVQAVSGGKNRTVVFDDVDISVVVERRVEGKRVPLPLVIRRANEKSAEQINAEIRNAQKQAIRNEGNYVLSENTVSRAAMKLYYALPQKLRLFIIDRMMNNPHRRKNMMGTVVVTSVGSVGRLPGWIIPKSMHNLCFALGSIVKKPRVIENDIQVRNVLNLTILFDHDVVDGVPAARFAAKRVERIEEGL